MDYIKRFYELVNKVIVTKEEFSELLNIGIVTTHSKEGENLLYPNTMEYLIETNCDDEYRVYVIE